MTGNAHRSVQSPSYAKNAKLSRPWYRQKLGRAVIFHGFVILLAFIMIYPILWLVGSSLKGADEIWTNRAAIIPKEIHLENYTNGWMKSGKV